MDFDLILEEIGEFGRYQQTNYLLLCFPVLFAAANSLTYVFTAGEPNYRCLIPECDDPINPVYNQPWVQNVIPGKRENASGLYVTEHCEKFEGRSVNQSQNALDQCFDENAYNHEVTLRCDRWVYDEFERTIMQEYEITCDENLWRLSLVGTMHFAGIVVGSAAAGILADNYGRKIIFVLSILFMAITGIGQAVSKTYITFTLFAFLNAVGTAGVFPLAFILGVEMVGPKKREMSGIVLNYFYAVGEAAVGLLAWLFRDWVTLQLLASAPPLLFVIYYWMVPESVRWLLARKDTGRASKIVKKAAQINGVELSEHILQSFELKESYEQEKEFDKSDIIEEKDKAQEHHEVWWTFKQLLMSRTLVIRCLILIFIWATNAFVFYGLSLTSVNLIGNKYLNFILVCLVEIPGYTMSWLAMNKIGRRWALAFSLFLCAGTCVAGGFVPQEQSWAIVLLFLVGKLGITSAFSTVYVHTAEMLPTVIRSGGVGAASTVARVGALVAPFVPLLRFIHKAIPLLLFGSVSFVAGLLSLYLPETLGHKLPDTAEEAERIGQDDKDPEMNINIAVK